MEIYGREQKNYTTKHLSIVSNYRGNDGLASLRLKMTTERRLDMNIDLVEETEVTRVHVSSITLTSAEGIGPRPEAQSYSLWNRTGETGWNQ